MNKLLALLGLAKRAGKLSFYEEANLLAIRSGRARLLVLAEDAGESTAKKYLDKCRYYQVPVVRGVSRENLGVALGSPPRTAVAVLDEGFAKKLTQLAR
ncbi:MAG: ribosomal L7Ae/L30e/S12e/Gadd45 family protein [Firmicutes bacterium]|nr:ribosomal L7Ae/L30e/S12e/Gadd45 family protein [Bacillota bacterium]MCL5993203.1 ribosomal L7Ae/L30e/S12e/Gadd45 family protein [Bacillota bacterium]